MMTVKIEDWVLEKVSGCNQINFRIHESMCFDDLSINLCL